VVKNATMLTSIDSFDSKEQLTIWHESCGAYASSGEPASSSISLSSSKTEICSGILAIEWIRIAKAHCADMIEIMSRQTSHCIGALYSTYVFEGECLEVEERSPIASRNRSYEVPPTSVPRLQGP
jgi:hypothetical protein